MIVRFFLCMLFSVTSVLHAAVPLRDGETLTYKVSWAVLPGAGEIKITAQNDLSGPTPRLRVITTTNTRGLAKILLPFEAKAESIFDASTGRLSSLTESNQQRNKHSAHSVSFDYAASLARYTPDVPDPKSRSLPLPAGEPLDLITCLVQTRAWDLRPGEKRDALVLFDDDFYELTIHAARLEAVTTSFGSFKTLVLEPRMEKTPPKGMFKKGSTVRVWISQDERRLPIRFEVEFKIGTGVATLIRYEPPAAEAKSAPRSASPPDEKNPRP